MFFTKEVKLERVEWEKIKKDYNALVKENTTLKADIKDCESIISRQSDEIKKRLKFENKDDLLFSYEQSNARHKDNINALEKQIFELKDNLKKEKLKIINEEALSDFLIKRIGKENLKTNCPELELMNSSDLSIEIH